MRRVRLGGAACRCESVTEPVIEPDSVLGLMLAALVRAAPIGDGQIRDGQICDGQIRDGPTGDRPMRDRPRPGEPSDPPLRGVDGGV